MVKTDDEENETFLITMDHDLLPIETSDICFVQSI